ncbi:hypothetical protein NPIL_264821 [Nephila pilipes]|uniref:Uncharacterized protein n=1 Tax=Nephila pilipes TaxID=299642 RepID=A0A8X6NXW4_NEPPI|nr:hypothetical protein NPIL_264821 [Nephila pilipes]
MLAMLGCSAKYCNPTKTRFLSSLDAGFHSNGQTGRASDQMCTHNSKPADGESEILLPYYSQFPLLPGENWKTERCAGLKGICST